MNKTVKTGNEGAKVAAVLEMVRIRREPNSVGFLPNLENKHHTEASAVTH